MPPTTSMLPEIKPKSHRRFLHHFSSPFGSLSSVTSTTSSPPVPSLPPFPAQYDTPTHRPELRSQPSTGSLGAGATIVRRPSDARRDMIANVTGKAISHRSLSASAAAALSRSLTGKLRSDTEQLDHFARGQGGIKREKEIRISPPIPPRHVDRPKSFAVSPSKGNAGSGGTLRVSDGSYTSSAPSTSGVSGSTDTTASDQTTLKTPRTPWDAPPPKSGMRKSISPQVSLPNLGAAGAHPYVHAGGHAHKASYDSITSTGSFTVSALTGRRTQEVPRRSTLKPPPKGSLPPTPPITTTPFRAMCLGVSSQGRVGGGEGEEVVLIKLHFAYSLAANHDTSPITIPWSKLLPCGGALVQFVSEQLREYRLSQSPPTASRGRVGYAESIDSEYGDAAEELTDADSATARILEEEVEGGSRESEYGYTALLRDEYLKSLWTDSPSQPDFSTGLPPMPITHAYPTPPKHRAKTRNQYVGRTAPTPPPFPASSPVPAATSGPLPPLPAMNSRISFGPSAPLQIRRSPSLPNTAASSAATSSRGGMGVGEHMRRPSVDTALSTARITAHTKPQSGQGEVAGGIGRGAVLEVKVLLLRNAQPYHLLAHRLLAGHWPRFEHGLRRKVEEEVRYLGMEGLLIEVKREKSAVVQGAAGYI